MLLLCFPGSPGHNFAVASLEGGAPSTAGQVRARAQVRTRVQTQGQLRVLRDSCGCAWRVELRVLAGDANADAG
ncbi:hypothetical protein C5E10_18315 [Pseudoclavibacter sp. RFBG4]|nr:hypothetical protein C5E10_18315 [Pseudoclavibacter sp. RFBG4]